MAENNAKTGAVRSADVDIYSFTSLPIIGIIGAARTAGEGMFKYGRLNYKRGMPVHQYLEHAMMHIMMYLAGDRSQPHLEHLSWNALAASESAVLFPELNAPHELGPGSTLTEEVRRFMEAMDPELKERRSAPGSEKLGQWKLSDLPDVRSILEQRAAQSLSGKEFPPPMSEPKIEEIRYFLDNGEWPTDETTPKE